MRCLYCGKELALLKRWTRGGQFCSEAHKKGYQDEYNRIGLSRLLQAQSKAVQAKASQQQEASGSNVPGPVNDAPVAVEEAPVEEIQKLDEALEDVVEVHAEEVAQETAEEVAEEVTPEPEEEAAWEPADLAGFVKEETAPAAAFESSVYFESWEPATLAPVAPAWQSVGALNQALPHAPILEFKFRPKLTDSEYSVPEVNMAPSEFVQAKAYPPAFVAILASNKLPGAGLVKQTVVPRVPKPGAVAGADGMLRSPVEVAYQESTLLQLASTEIAFPSEDADVVLAQENADVALWPAAIADEDLPQAEAVAAEQLPEDTFAEEEAIQPGAPTEGLVRLHHELTQVQAEKAPVTDGAYEGPDGGDARATEEPAREEEPEAAASVEEVPAEEPPKPRNSGLPVEMPVKIYSPSKPSPREGAGALVKLPVFLPVLTGLPLRPKMGLVPLATGPGAKRTSPRPAGPGTKPAPEVKSAAEAKSAPEVKPVAETATPVTETKSTESKPGADPKAGPDTQSKEGTGTRGLAPISTKAWGKATPRAPQGQAASSSVKVQPAAPPKGPAAPGAKIAGAAPARALEDGKKAGKTSTPSGTAEKIAVSPAANTATLQPEARSQDIEGPSFGATQAGSASFTGSLKGKLAIGAAAIVVCVAGYVIFGGKPQTPASSTTAAADKAGPSIMVGGGGWVEGWAGDPIGTHAGRQITLYRPSLKLSDYRIEFKGEIETKSLGWVFRATDPENYYAMKLAIVTPGLEPKIALVKSLVSHGRETQIGKVPINLNVRLDTLYTVRVDVRGSKFTTYVQGQQMDSWSDEQLKSGGVGFLNEREERGRIKSVSVSLLNGGKQ